MRTQLVPLERSVRVPARVADGYGSAPTCREKEALRCQLRNEQCTRPEQNCRSIWPHPLRGGAGGEGGIRNLGRLLTYARLASGYLRPWGCPNRSMLAAFGRCASPAFPKSRARRRPRSVLGRARLTLK